MQGLATIQSLSGCVCRALIIYLESVKVNLKQIKLIYIENFKTKIKININLNTSLFKYLDFFI